MSHFNRLLEFYESGGPVPWDGPNPPPEVLDLVPTLPIGRALDLGCGLGRAALYMARLGWQVDGIDFIPKAITEATNRAEQAGLLDKINFHLGPVTELDFLSGPYDFALDVGCAHGFDLDELRAYHQHLLRLLKPDGHYLLFARLDKDDGEPDEQRWMDETILREIFQIGFSLEKVEYGETQVEDQPAWSSAWFWFKRDG